ncbi:alpha-L-rhamnosidase [Microbacterium saperdae]|uniref:alpha-L-rhamnosidase n=1 Tax=Microbacterium saperdae TaxID=69368 RepID=A0A543BIT7_9MICO|nr:alpha-L-rhamnosidase [Microbacterium saperdae]TQL84754.1 alpha-L-rhamnosidase [Microbacterium saperdae]GGM64313.1 alpha-L-rhamnosidase [Microbacterium saperdae]
MTTVNDLRFDDLRGDSHFIGSAQPRLHWNADVHEQRAVQIRLRTGTGEESIEIRTEERHASWPFSPLVSRAQGDVAVRVRDDGSEDGWSDWSEARAFTVVPLGAEDWSARFIGPTDAAPAGPAPVLTRSFDVRPGLVSAVLHISALGAYDLDVNGVRTSDRVLAPGWTAYDHRLRHHSDDVTALLREGRNDIRAVLGNGWYRSGLTWHRHTDLYGSQLALLAQFELAYSDGTREVIGTDEQWSAHETGILANDLYDGETRDLRMEDGPASPVVIVEYPLERLVPPESEPIREVRRIAALDVFRSPSGRMLVDFGENIVGWVRLVARVPRAGQEVRVRHAEVLEHGELGVRPLRGAQATDVYLLGDREDTVELEPRFTFHGFRYVEIDGLEEDDLIELDAVVLASDLERRGWFACDDPRIDQLHENVVRSMYGNFLDVPTDCPQRDERLGWTGDIQVFGPSAVFLADVTGFLSSWLRDLAAEQHVDGIVPMVVPDVLRDWSEARAAWGDAATIVPWTLYEETGDTSILERQFSSMTAWVACISELAGPNRLWEGSPQFGDWLAPDAPPDDAAAGKSDPDVIATAYFARSTWICRETARVLGRSEDELFYAQLHREIVDAFVSAYVEPDGRVYSDAQTVYALALQWDLLPDDSVREAAGARLEKLVSDAGFHVDTGFVGTPLILDALTDAGYVDAAYRMLLQTECPSWLYPVTMGATTIWERWDSMLPDGTINPGEMTSFNHYALGAVADWLHRRVAGLTRGEPGWRTALIAPMPGGGLYRASASHVTPYGIVESSWAIQETGEFRLDVIVPAGMTATVVMPFSGEPITDVRGRRSFTAAIEANDETRTARSGVGVGTAG